MRKLLWPARLGQGLATLVLFDQSKHHRHEHRIETIIHWRYFRTKMSLAHASRHAVNHGASLRSSYAEISRFVRTRHHGITLNRAPQCLRIAARSFATLQPGAADLSPEQKLRKTLDDYKESSMHALETFHQMLTACSANLLEGPR